MDSDSGSSSRSNSFTYRPKTYEFAVFCRDMSNAKLDALVKELAKETGSETLDWGTSIGRDFLKVKNCASEIKRIPALINACLRRGYDMYMNDGSGISFPKGSLYTPRLHAMRRLEAMCGLASCGMTDLANRMHMPLRAEDWPWPEDVRDTLARIARLTKAWPRMSQSERKQRVLGDHMHADPLFREDSCMHHEDRRGLPKDPGWDERWANLQSRISECWPGTAETAKEAGAAALSPIVIADPDQEMGDVAEPPAKKPKADQKEEEEEVKECMVCLERPATTMAWPCEHVVCCQQCSDQLKDTPNAKLCIYCRRPITHVLDDPKAS